MRDTDRTLRLNPPNKRDKDNVVELDYRIKFYVLDTVTEDNNWYVQHELNRPSMGEKFMILVNDDLSLDKHRDAPADYEIRNNTRNKMVAITIDDYYKLLSIHNFFIYDCDEEESYDKYSYDEESDGERDLYIILISKDFSEDFSDDAYFTYFEDDNFYTIYRTHKEAGWIELTRNQYEKMKRDIDSVKLKETADTISKRDFIKDIMNRYEEVCKQSEIIKQENIEEEKRKQEEREETKKMVEAQRLKQIKEEERKQLERERIEELTRIEIAKQSTGISKYTRKILRYDKFLHSIINTTTINDEVAPVKDIKNPLPAKPIKEIVVSTNSSDAIINDVGDPNIKEFLRKNSFMRKWYTIRMTMINEKKYTKTLMEKARGNTRK